MNISNLRQLYTPIQPTVKQASDHVTYQEFLPDTSLQNYIYCYWRLKTTDVLSAPFSYRVVADGCMDIFFDLNNTTDSFVMGFCKTYTQFPLEESFDYVGIRFLPTIFPQIYKIRASRLSNTSAPLSSIAPPTAQFIADKFSSNLNTKGIQTHLDNYFIKMVSQNEFDDDSRLYDAIEIILNKYGVLNIETDLNTGISPRQLRRLFDYYIGDSAKTFSRVVRFQNILKAKPSRQSLRDNKLFYNTGYYDQAHFVKEFKNFYGITPSKAL